MFHLGDWNSPFATSCNEASFQVVDELFQNSPVPVYFVPGDNEYNGTLLWVVCIGCSGCTHLIHVCPCLDCPNPSQAFGFWYQYLLGYEEKHWPPPTDWKVVRQAPNYRENFSFSTNGVLFVGINLVGGVVHDATEWDNRFAANLQWIDQNYDAYVGQQQRLHAMVILGHADPDIQANDAFFDSLWATVETKYASVPVIFIHRNLGIETWGLQSNYEGIPNLHTVTVLGAIWPPMLVEIEITKDESTSQSTIELRVDQESWYTP